MGSASVRGADEENQASRVYRPHPGQLAFHNSDARFRVLACGARWGKDIATIEEGIKWARLIYNNRLPNPNLVPLIHFWTVAPNYPMARQFWRDLKMRFPRIYRPKWNNADRSLEAFGGKLLWEIKSADNPESLVAVGLDLVMMVEAALTQGQAWDMSIRPRLASPGRVGIAIFNGTAKGSGDYYENLYRMGQDPAYPDWWSTNEPSSNNPYIDPEELIALKKEMPDRWYRQEILGQFLSNEGAVFRNIRENICPLYTPGDWLRPIMIGVDWGKKYDFTVFTAMDATWRVLDIGRVSVVDWKIQRRELGLFADKFKPQMILAEQNNVGDPLIESLREELPYPIMGFTTTNPSKVRIINQLAIAMERNRVRYPDIPVLISELQAYEMSVTSAKNIIFGGSGRWHDDCVMSLALALEAHGNAKEEQDDSSNKFSRFRVGGQLSMAGAF